MQKIPRELVFVCCMFALPGYAADIEEDTQKRDVALASVWGVSQLSQGGYGKPGLYTSAAQQEWNVYGELEGGWRFSRHFTLGMNLRASLRENSKIESQLVLIGFVFGWHEALRSGQRIITDVKLGNVDVPASNESHLFLEPGIQWLFRKGNIGIKKLVWSVGISYRYVEEENVTLMGKNGLSSIGLNLGLVFGNY